MKQLAEYARQGLLAPIDVELGGLLLRKASSSLPDIGEARIVALTGALLSARRASGHSCLDLASLAGRPPFAEGDAPALPGMAQWRSVLERSRICGDGVEPSPLVLDGDRLYLYRFHAAEQRLAKAVRGRLVTPGKLAPPDAETVRLFRAMFDVATSDSIDWQAVAASAALRSRLTVITGGPGTGKTTTVARILALLLQREPALRIALAAPTGKAAARLSESIAANVARLPLDEATRERVPTAGRTLHRLLGYQPWNDTYLHGPDRPLADDVIVVDEASMVDLLMMDALFAAVRPNARIILLGDQDQLASVETGYVLGDICQAAAAVRERSTDDGGYGAAFCAWYGALSGQRVAPCEDAGALRDTVVRLRRSYRFERQPGIGALASAIRAGDGAGVLSVLDDGGHADVRRRDPVRTTEALLEPLASLIDEYLASGSAGEALERLAAFRVLCATREGPTGVSGLNEGIERWLRTRGVPTRARWYDGRPVLVTANDPTTRLFNGDVGVALSVDGRMEVWFPDGHGAVRPVSTSRLPAHETAWAMTVHKAQGSEFDRVVLVLPPSTASSALTREMVYTGVTRARESVDVVGRGEVLVAAVGRTVARGSGLGARLAS